MGEEKSSTSIIQYKIRQANFIDCYSLEFDLYDISENWCTYTFNVSTLNPFGYICYYYVGIARGFVGSGLIIWNLPSKKSKL